MLNPVYFSARLQPLAFLFLLVTGCATTSGPSLDAWIPEGYYHFSCDIVNQNNLALVSHNRGRMEVQLLGDFDGGFAFSPEADGGLTITKSNMDYPGLKRSFRGEGTVQQPGVASGSAITWIKSVGPIGRDHRKGPWRLRPATPKEIQRVQQRQQRLREVRDEIRKSAETP